MPYLKVTSDKRGYQITSLLHRPAGQHRSKPRLLFWCRTPVSARVKRQPLDEEAILALQARHPGLVFEWSRLLAGLSAANSGGQAAYPAGVRGVSRAREPARHARARRRRDRGSGSGGASSTESAPSPAVPSVEGRGQPGETGDGGV